MLNLSLGMALPRVVAGEDNLRVWTVAVNTSRRVFLTADKVDRNPVHGLHKTDQWDTVHVKSSLGQSDKVTSILRGINKCTHGAAQQVNKLAAAEASCHFTVSCSFTCEASLHSRLLQFINPKQKENSGFTTQDLPRLHNPCSAANNKLLPCRHSQSCSKIYVNKKESRTRESED
jgi:hypothetical protein